MVMDGQIKPATPVDQNHTIVTTKHRQQQQQHEPLPQLILLT
jgi:hypothetical protein